VIFAALLLAALGAFAWTLRRFGRMVLAGKPEPRFDRIPERLNSVLVYFFGQKKVVEDVPIPSKRAKGLVKTLGSRHHVLIFWGFILITVGTVELLIRGLFPSFSYALILGETVARVLASAIDVFNLIVLAMIVFGAFRRLVLQPRLIPMSRDAAIILSAIGLLMISHFGMHGFGLVAHGPSPADPVGPVSRAIAGAFGGMSPATAGTISVISHWVHVAVLLLFLNYLLYSKHSHIVAALPNIYFRNLGARGVLPKLNLEADDMSQTGIVSDYKDFTWKTLLDGFACTECARCTNQCPAYNTGKPLSPMQVVHDVRDDLRTKMPDRGPLDALLDRMQHGASAEKPDAPIELVGGRTSEETLWSCTTCGACQQVCPVFIDQPKMILEMWRNLVLLQEKVPPDLARTFKNLEQNGNPWGIAADKRMDWAATREKPVPTLDDKPDAEYLLWVGCAGAYDDRIKKQTHALVDILEEGGVDFAVLGLEEGCTGDPARRSGNEMLYQMQAQQNVETMNAKKVKKVITACPHCLHTIANEYPQLGGNFEVRHHTQVIRDLVDSGKVRVTKDPDGTKRPVFHDPCYLGRWNGEYDAPRTALDAVSNGRVEAPRNRELGFCCGAGGGRMWMEEKIGERVNHNRVDELISTGATTIATACPFCTIMVNDGVNDRGAEDKVQVLNVSEVIARSMVRKREIDAGKTAPPA
ncbi:MAG TPA: (Fe-S)-binding protein, partial [Polyangia bacterium]